MYISFFIYSLSSIFSKLASMQDFMSLKYVFCFGAINVILGLYAVLWQQVLKKVELYVAMSNKPLVLVFNCIIGFFLFKEAINYKMIIGMALITVGLVIIGYKKEPLENEK